MPTYPLDQVMRAISALRTAAGLPQESFPVEAFVGMISDEVEAARAKGLTDQAIVDLIQQTSGIEIDVATLRAHYATPEQRHAHQQR